ncbi:MAG TPA: LamG domain-containing protein, partial [Nitrospirota bacterium]|nr:LamG domain-containing protein [Nitrospirota bacterium]
CPACSNGYLKYSGQAGAKAEFSFYGTGVKWNTAKAPVLGKAKIYFDGAYKGMVDLYRSTVQYPLVLGGSGIPPGNHTLTVEVSGQKNLGSTGYYTLIDAFEVISANVLSLDGVDDKTTATTTIFPNTSTAQSFTVEAWIYPTSYGTVYIATDDAYDLKLEYNTAAANSGLGIYFRLWSTCGSSTSQTEYRDVTLNQWNHVAGIFDASAQQFEISINGILSSSPVSFTASTFCSDTAQHFEVGGFYNSSNYTFEGKINEVRVSDTIRYTSGFTPVGYFTSDANTKGLWHFDESAGSTSFSDSSGNGNTLTGLNGAQTGTAP